MKKIIVIGLCLILITILSACSTNKTPSKGVENNSSNTEVSQTENKQEQKEMTVFLTTIDGWNKVEGSTALIQYLKDGNSVIVTRDIMPSDAKTPESFIEYVKGMLSKTFDSVGFEDASQMGISDPNKHLLVYTYSLKVGGADYQMKAWAAYIFHDNYAYTLTCGALSNNFSNLEGDFKTFMESFKLVPKE